MGRDKKILKSTELRWTHCLRCWRLFEPFHSCSDAVCLWYVQHLIGHSWVLDESWSRWISISRG